MIKNNNPVILFGLIGIVPGILFIMVYLIPISERVFGIIGYLSCILASLVIIFLGPRWGLYFRYSLFPSMGVLLSSFQVLSKNLLGYKTNIFLIPGFLLLVEFLCMIYFYRNWRKQAAYLKGFTVRLILGSILILGILSIYFNIGNNQKSLDYFILWIIYSLPMIICSASLSNQKQINAWVMAFSFIPFITLEIFPYSLPEAISDHNLHVIHLSNILLYIGFFLVIPLLVMSSRNKVFNRVLVLFIGLIFICIVIYSRWLVQVQSFEEIMPFKLTDVVIINIFLVYMPVVILTVMELKPGPDSKISLTS